MQLESYVILPIYCFINNVIIISETIVLYPVVVATMLATNIFGLIVVSRLICNFIF